MAVEYGTIAVVPMGEWDESTPYEVANLVTLDGSSYVAHTKPPVGTPPTDKAYWQVSAQGASKATMDNLGVVKPDTVTTEVNADGAISVKTASQDAAGIVKGSAGITVGEGGSIDVNTSFEQATELANIIAGEAIAQVLGKVSKSIAVTMGLDQNALLKNMLTNIDTNDTNKVPSAALVHSLYERIGMGTELTAGGNLTGAVNELNSNLGSIKYYVFNNAAYTADAIDAMMQDYYSQIAEGCTAIVRLIPSGPQSICIVQKTSETYGSYIRYGYASDPVYAKKSGGWVVDTLIKNSIFDFLRINNGSFADTLKNRGDSMTVCAFYNPTDNPFTFSLGYCIALNSGLIHAPNTFLLIGVSVGGLLEVKQLII